MLFGLVFLGMTCKSHTNGYSGDIPNQGFFTFSYFRYRKFKFKLFNIVMLLLVGNGIYSMNFAKDRL